MGFLEDDMFDFSIHPAGRTPSYYWNKRAGNIFYGITDGAGPWNGFAHYPNGAGFTNTKFAKRTSFLGEFNVNCLNEPKNGKVYVSNKKGTLFGKELEKEPLTTASKLKPADAASKN